MRKVNIKNMFKTLRYYVISMLVAMFCCMSAKAQTASPTLTFTSTETKADSTLENGGSTQCEAPQVLRCAANIDRGDYTSAVCEWRLQKAGEPSPRVVRFEENTSFDVVESGSWKIVLLVTMTKNDTITDENGETKVVENVLNLHEEMPMGFNVTIKESSLICYDGFSPNGDGVNDVLRIRYKSIVELNLAIFNRWGNRLVQLDSSALNDYENDNGEKMLTVWDGMIGGRPAKDGVYFINIHAVGSDGIEYKIKKAINVLKGFKRNDETDGSGGEI